MNSKHNKFPKNILLIGSGGRESALGWKIANSPSFINNNCKLISAPGNPGLSKYSDCININVEDLNSIIKFVSANKIDFVVVGPEIPLSLGLVDQLQKIGIDSFGPSKAAAQIESSKIFTKDLLKKYNIPTANYKSFKSNQKSDALEYLKNQSYPCVIKADGLAAGKGVIIAENYQMAENTVKEFLDDKIFSDAGSNFVVEDFLIGQETSVFAITDGENFVTLPASQDHKKIGDNDTGKNTGGMGAYAPANKVATPEILEKTKSKIIEPVIKAMKSEGCEFKGCLYAGLMISPDGEPNVIEFNCRFGDPETQVVLPLIKSDFLELLIASATNNINSYKLETHNKYFVSVVLASGGYPEKYEKGFEISGLETLNSDTLVFHSGTALRNNKLITSGGRVLNIVSGSDISISDAREKVYNEINKLNFENMYYRKDIASKG
ncbi:MAG TPA: phosphoribosylamine--glycine ligase [Ignavibacteria bacterium]|nr:phosphoribosylamine--glycine ligase [Ignavibacteria bacterium]